MRSQVNPSIMIIGNNPRNLELLERFLTESSYRVIPIAHSEDELQHYLDIEKDIQLALVDISGYDRNIWDWCERIRTSGIQLLVVSQKQSIELTNESIRHGASGVLIKPLVMKELLKLIDELINDN